MPAPIPVELHPHDPSWADLALQESARLVATLGDVMVIVHHIGSTAIPGIHAKPILDLMPIVHSFTEFDPRRPILESLGYGWWGEYGISGRRYCQLDDPVTGRRKIQLHCFEQNAPQIARHLAFRDYLRSRPDLARAYDAEKARCRDLHPQDSHAYTDCKDAWIRHVEKAALDHLG